MKEDLWRGMHAVVCWKICGGVCCSMKIGPVEGYAVVCRKICGGVCCTLKEDLWRGMLKEGPVDFLYVVEYAVACSM